MDKNKTISLCSEWPAYRQLFVVLLHVAVVGCGGSELDVAPAEGTVTLDGKAVNRAGIIFRPDLGPLSTAVSDAEGHFHLMTGKVDGALVGKHRITVTHGQGSKMEESYGGTMGAPIRQKKQAKPKPSFPEQYEQVNTSGLTATIKRGEKNTIDLQLTSKESKK